MAIKTVTDLIAAPVGGVPSYIGDGILPVGGKLIIAGVGGVGKSILISNLALDAAAGDCVWGVPALSVPQPLPILYLENEVGLAGLCSRFQTLGRFKSSPDAHARIVVASQEPLLFATHEEDQKVNSQWDAWRQVLEPVRPAIVIADPFATFHDLNENDNTDMRRITGAIDNITRLAREKLELSISWIIVHHFKKVGPDDVFGMNLFRGASRFSDWADTRVLIQFHKNTGSPDGISHNYRQINFAVVRQGPPMSDIWTWIDPCSLVTIPMDLRPATGLAFG